MIKKTIVKIKARIRARKTFRFYKSIVRELERDKDFISLFGQWKILEVVQERLFKLARTAISLDLREEIYLYLKHVINLMDEIASKHNQEVKNEEHRDN